MTIPTNEMNWTFCNFSIKMSWIIIFRLEGLQGPSGSKDTGTGNNVIGGIHDGDIMASIKDPNMKEIVAKESLQYKPNSKNEGPEVSEENKKALANLLEVSFELHIFIKNQIKGK